MPTLTELATLISPNNPNPLSKEQLEALTAHLTLSELQILVELCGLGDLAHAAQPVISRVMAAAQTKISLTSAINDDEIDSLIRQFDLSSIANEADAPPDTPPSPPNPPSPSKARVKSASTTPARLRAVYSVSSPQKKGYVDNWLDAAHQTQGVAGASVHAVAKSPKPSKPSPHAYAVFFGREVGAFESWTTVHVLVTGLSLSYQSGFPSLAAAKEALSYARGRGWTGDSQTVHSPLPLPSSYEPNALNSPHGTSPSVWYVVTCGVNPGIYSSGLECHLNIAGVSGAAHKTFQSRHEAEAAFSAQMEKGQVKQRARKLPLVTLASADADPYLPSTTL
ncbi:hypothetical protein B0H13DRAFT_2331758 [Mycena leptocephala]|nr:hypothetical protein B0H13DRAFT_2331758 [Mycena leptocephala]